RETTRGAPGAVAALKQILRDAIEAPHDRRRAREHKAFVAGWIGPDHEEAVEAFFAGRAPVWSRPVKDGAHGVASGGGSPARSSTRSRTPSRIRRPPREDA